MAKAAVTHSAQDRQDIGVQERAVLFGLTTAAYLAKKAGWSRSTFMRASTLAWNHEKPKPDAEPPRPALDEAK